MSSKHLFPLALLALSLAGCDRPEAADAPAALNELADDEVPAVNEGAFTVDDNPVIATLDGELPGKIEFLDEAEAVGGEPVIGVVAIGPEGSRALGLIDGEDATPLEVFLALAPASSTPPQALVDDHQRLAADGLAAAEPRALATLRSQTYEEMCDQPGQFADFWDTWSSGYGSHSAFQYIGPIEDVYIQTGTTYQRALAACRHNFGTWADMNLQKYNTFSSSWTIFYTQDDVARWYGLAYRSTSTITTAKYRERITSNDGDFYVGANW